MSKAIDGQTVSIHYTGSLEDGTVFDSSAGRDPLELTLGAGQVIPSFETAVRALEIGESIKVNIPPEEAYGEYREDMLIALNRAHFPGGTEPEIGMEVDLQAGEEVLPATILEITDDAIVLDMNHPLAGKTLTFNIRRVDLAPASAVSGVA